MRLGALYTPLRSLVHRLRETERLGLKAFERYLPGWLGYPLSLLASKAFRLSARAARCTQLPLREELVMYEAYNGRDFAGNPYALFLHLLERPEYRHLQHVLVAPSPSHPKVQPFRRHPRVQIVRPNSRRYIKYAETCTVFINNASYKPYLVKREGQCYVYTWHSTLLKKLAADKSAPWEARNVNRTLLCADYFISPNRFTTDLLLKSHGAEGLVDAPIAEFGYPRNDLTINADVPSVKLRLGLKADEKLILFAPTWRGEQFARDTVGETLQWRRQLEAGLPDEYRVLVKFHTMVYRFLDRRSLKECVPLGLDINEALAAADVLVTDYSGIFFDYLTTGKPIVFFSPDRAAYTKAKQGFYLDLDTLPGPVFETIDEVAEAVRNISTIKGQYQQQYADFRRCYVGQDDGQASRRTADLVMEGKTDPRVYTRSPEKKRLLFYPGPMNPNGVTTSFISLLSQLDYSKWSVAVLLPDDSRNREFQKRLDPRAGVFYLGAPDSFGRGEYATHARFIKKGARTQAQLPVESYRRTMRRVFGDLRFDRVINFHGYQPVDAARMAFGASAGRRVIFLHNDLERDRTIKQPQLHSVFSTYKFYDKLFCVSADSLQANIEGMAAYVKREFSDELVSKMDYTRNLIEPDKIISRANEPLESDYPPPREADCSFITIGRLSPEKNHRRLFDALSLVKQNFPNTVVYVVGNGRLSKHLRRLAVSMGLADSVVFIPFTANPYPLIKACDCFVLSSDIEGQPITILEALSLNKPVIATNIAGPRGLLEDGYGQLVEPDAAALAAAMEQFIRDGKTMERHSFDARAYVQSVLEEFEHKILEDRA